MAIASRTIVPAHPPFPTARNLPFQFSAGSHSSISIWESADGVSVASTRQKAGSCLKAALCWAAPGTENAPAATACAEVILVSGSASDASRSQLAVSGTAGAAAAGIMIVAGTNERPSPAISPTVRRNRVVKLRLLEYVNYSRRSFSYDVSTSRTPSARQPVFGQVSDCC